MRGIGKGVREYNKAIKEVKDQINSDETSEKKNDTKEWDTEDERRNILGAFRIVEMGNSTDYCSVISDIHIDILLQGLRI